MPFDPSTLTVKKAIAKLDGLSDEDLNAAYDAELDGKGRKSLLDAITSARDDIREVASMLAEPAVADMPADSSSNDLEPEPAAQEEPQVETIDLQSFMRLRGNQRKAWVCISPNVFKKIG